MSLNNLRVEIHSQKNGFLGSGILVQQDLVMTCRHVVTGLAKNDLRTIHLGEPRDISNVRSLDLPPETSANDPSAYKTDVAMLELEEAFTQNVDVPSWSTAAYPGRKVKFYVRRAGTSIDHPELITTTISGYSPERSCWQVQEDSAWGFSGGPVCLEEAEDTLLGMVVSRMSERPPRTYFIPTRSILRIVDSFEYTLRRSDKPPVRAVITLIRSVSDDILAGAFEKLLSESFAEDPPQLRFAHLLAPDTSGESPVVALVTPNSFSHTEIPFAMGVAAVQSRPFRIALVAPQIDSTEVSHLEGFKRRNLANAAQIRATLTEIGSWLGSPDPLGAQGAVEQFIDTVMSVLEASGIKRLPSLLRLPRKVLNYASQYPIALNLLSSAVRDLQTGQFNLYLPEEIYQHDAEAIAHLTHGEFYFATHPTYANPGAPTNVRYQEYIDAQCKACDRGVIVTRIYIDNGENSLEADALRDEMDALSKAGANILTLGIAALDRSFHDDFVLIDRRMLGLGWPQRGPMLFSSYQIGDATLIEDYVRYFKVLEFHARRYAAPPKRYQTAAHVEKTPVRIEGRPSRRLMIVLRTNGCSYDEGKRGCKMCDFRAHAIDAQIHKVTADDLLQQLEAVLSQHLDASIEQVDLLTLGNFLHTKEVPEAFQLAAMHRLATLSQIRKVVVESRPQYINPLRLQRLRRALRKNQILELGVGVESSDDRIRNNVLHKMLSWDELRNAMRMAASSDVAFMAYLLIKPQTLTEREAIEDAVRSAHDVATLATECKVPLRIAYEPVFVTAGTDLERHFVHFHDYQILNLWSVIEVLKRTAGIAPVFVGLSDENLSHDRKPRSCTQCNDTLVEAIESYNATNDAQVLDQLYCPCRRTWAETIG